MRVVPTGLDPLPLSQPRTYVRGYYLPPPTGLGLVGSFRNSPLTPHRGLDSITKPTDRPVGFKR
jgi:hypothetical protein